MLKYAIFYLTFTFGDSILSNAKAIVNFGPVLNPEIIKG